jgi:hypothetical protein
MGSMPIRSVHKPARLEHDANKSGIYPNTLLFIMVNSLKIIYLQAVKQIWKNENFFAIAPDSFHRKHAEIAPTAQFTRLCRVLVLERAGCNCVW